MLNLAPTRGSDAAPELPDPFFRRLRSIALADDVTEAQRARIRAALGSAVSLYIEHLEAVAAACDGPDPEVALLYMLDSAATMRAALVDLEADLRP